MEKHPPENVWDYPRPPRVELVSHRVRIEHQGSLVAHADRAHRVLETSHPPVYYIALRYIRAACLVPSKKPSTHCEWKGVAEYYDLQVPGNEVFAACWSYPRPTPGFEEIAGAVAFFPTRVDCCMVDGEFVKAQAGDFYGGWINTWIHGGERGFKGGVGTSGW
ncbi:MAG: DUF427 domain-containing protein [Planctomycetota bacterium]